MRIVDRYLISEVLISQIAVGLVLGLVIVGSTFVRLLGYSAGGNLPVALLAPLVAVESLKAMMLLTPVALFLATMLTLGRLYRDSEMAALQAAGIGQGRIYSGLLLLAVPLALLLLWLMLAVYPWASAKSDTIQREGQQRMSLAAISSGRFLTFDSGRAVGFIGGMRHGGRVVENVFVQSNHNGKRIVLLAHDGTQKTDSATGQRVLMLHDGVRYEGSPGQADFRILKFKHYAATLALPSLSGASDKGNARSSLKLWQDGSMKDLAELQWRLSVPISVLILIFIAVPLSYVRPRQGRYSRLAVAILIYVFYANLLIVAKSWMEQGVVPAWIGMWWPHVLFVLFGSILWWRRARQRSGRRKRARVAQ
ncbi:LPS export ABC transporter permease LptF [Acidihalobacter ferrooxydans]|uniref:Lipopolysaccharide export system permease protein LptF n=1 Tax=Acidihalobacter ferrooxydans TaxID=1765967 RepID=A0A1P8UHC9_9GAMM|nr:LPS export ABC transporter permease LptF [Acidihalobacter ferrooxydans]APZ43248.1 LPS export ABC transporter permease LptF [Acidihalobacter ferrooxydans]